MSVIFRIYPAANGTYQDTEGVTGAATKLLAVRTQLDTSYAYETASIPHNYDTFTTTAPQYNGTIEKVVLTARFKRGTNLYGGPRTAVFIAGWAGPGVETHDIATGTWTTVTSERTVNPDTSSAWTNANIRDLEIGYGLNKAGVNPPYQYCAWIYADVYLSETDGISYPTDTLIRCTGKRDLFIAGQQWVGQNNFNGGGNGDYLSYFYLGGLANLGVGLPNNSRVDDLSAAIEWLNGRTPMQAFPGGPRALIDNPDLTQQILGRRSPDWGQNTNLPTSPNLDLPGLPESKLKDLDL